MFRSILALASLFFVLIVIHASVAEEEGYRVGDTWIYKLSGSKTGTEVTKVTGVEEKDGKRFWNFNLKKESQILKAVYDDDGNTCSMFLRKDRQLMFDPPFFGYKTLMDLNENEERILKSTVTPMGLPLSLIFEVKAKRLKNETVTVPAGTYENCAHFFYEVSIKGDREVMESALPLGNGEFWYDPKVNGYVKEIITDNDSKPKKGDANAEKPEISELQQYVRGKNKG